MVSLPCGNMADLLAWLVLLSAAAVVSADASESALQDFLVAHRPPEFAVIGQSKTGTSTLWFNLKMHPRLKSMGLKEVAFWQTEGGVGMCDNSVEMYLEMAAVQRRRFGVETLLGDFSTTYLSCVCCPSILKQLKPDMKIIIMLREPIKRAISRFVEQQNNRNFAFHGLVANKTFSMYSSEAIESINSCLMRARALGATAANRRRLSAAGSPGASAMATAAPEGVADAASAAAAAAAVAAAAATALGASSESEGAAAGAAAAATAGGEPPFSLLQRLEFQCFQRSNIVGWSVYDVYLDHWLRYFPKDQVLVLYTEDLQQDPIATFRKVESFLGVEPYQYDPKVAEAVYNPKGCYNWHCAKNKTDVQASATNANSVGAAVRQLVDFYRPHVKRVIQLADEGTIAPVPPAWRAVYA